MHNALYVQEILGAIAQSLPTTIDPRHDIPVPDRPTLAALACTCQSFYESSMDILWSTPASLRALLACMPPGVVQWGRLANDVLTLSKEPTEEQWSIAFKHAYRIRSLVLCHTNCSWETHSGGVLFDNTVLAAFAKIMIQRLDRTRSYQLLFPRLRHLYYQWGLPPATLLSHIPLFAGPTLQSIFVNSDYTYRPPAVSLCPPEVTLPSFSFSQLTNLRIRHTLDSDLTRIADICGILPHWERIRSIDITLSIGRREFEFFTELPNLSRLSVSLAGDGLAETCRELRIQPAFPCLQELQLTIEDITIAIAILENISPSRLKKLNLQTRPWRDPADLQLFFSYIRSLPALVDIQVGVINLGSYIGWDHPGTDEFFIDSCYITQDTLQPLLSIKSLTRLSIGLNDPIWGLADVVFELNDTIIIAMASAWPELEDLTLASSCGIIPRLKTTLDTLLLLRQRCPRLRTLGLDIDAEGVSEELQRATLSFEDRHNLTKLVLGGSQPPPEHEAIPQPEVVAEVLARMFPRLETFVVDGATPSSGWSRVVKAFESQHFTLLHHSFQFT